MQFEITKSELEQELNRTVGISKRGSNVVPALSHIALDASEGRLKMVASDLSTSLVTEAEAIVTEAGSACVPAGKLHDFVKLASNGSIKFNVMDNGWMKVKTESSTFKLPAIARDQFPETPTVHSEQIISIPSNVLSQLLSRTMFAMSKKEGNYALHNLKLDIEPESITLTAADGFRMARAKAALTDNSETMNTLIPDFTAGQLLRFAEGHGGDVTIQSSENHLHFQFGKRRLISSLSTGEFPNLDEMFPKEAKTSIEFNTERLALSIRRAALMVSDYGNSIVMNFKNGKISTTSSDKGEVQEIMPTEVRAPLVMTFNYKFFLDVLENVKTERIILDLQGELKPAQIRPAGEADGSEYRCIVMPKAFNAPDLEDDTETEVEDDSDVMPL